MKPEVRLYAHGTSTIPIVRMGDITAWSMVRRADYRGAAPFVISRKEWDRAPVREVVE